MDLNNITMDDLKAKFAAFDKKTLIKFGIGIGSMVLFLIIYYAILNPMVKERKLKPSIQPKVDIKKFEEGKDLEFNVSFQVMPEIPDFDLKKIIVEKSKLNIQRFKGLGEMNPDELWNTTLNPETRNLLKVEYSKDAKKDHEIIHTLMGNDVALRKDFIISNAIDVLNLDI